MKPGSGEGIVIAAPDAVVRSLASLLEAIGQPAILAGGWAVRCRLRMARVEARPTEDLDVVLTRDLRPAREALADIDAVQADPDHPCRLIGLPLVVDLLAASDGTAVGVPDDLVTDPDGLHLLVPPFASTLVAAVDLVTLSATDASVVALLPRAGALFAAKVGNIALDEREATKRATDGEDALRLLTAFGAVGVVDDLRVASPRARARLVSLLDQIGSGGLLAQGRVAGYVPDARLIDAAVLAVRQMLAAADAP